MASKNPMDPAQFLAGQLAALETVTQALFLTHPDKAIVARTFKNETSKNELLSLPKMPVAFREGYSDRAKRISAWMADGQAKGTKRLPRQL